MSGNNLFADTNILLHILNGSKMIEPYSDAFFIISFVTEIEILGHKNLNSKIAIEIKKMIRACFVVEMSRYIKERIIWLKQQYNIKTPDAIIVASAIEMSLPFITADKTLKK